MPTNRGSKVQVVFGEYFLVDTTAKMSQAAKQRLETLRAEIARRTGRRVTQREVLEHLVLRASQDPASEAAALDRGNRSMGPGELRRFLKRRRASGVRDLSADIDRHLYGGRP